MPVLVPRLLIVGLGNAPMPGTRHSVGHLVVDAVAQRIGATLSPNTKLKCIQGEGSILVNDVRVAVTLIKPKALMNICGPPTAAALRAASLQPQNMIVIHDSLEHKPGTLSPKKGGSAQGHNGVRSVIAALGADDFRRIRIGIGRPTSGVTDYVLGRLSGFERTLWSGDEGVDLVMEAIEKICVDLGIVPR